jgi:hypothetical protein
VVVGLSCSLPPFSWSRTQLPLAQARRSQCLVRRRSRAPIGIRRPWDGVRSVFRRLVATPGW